MSSRPGAVSRALDAARRRTETSVVLCIDVEPDPRVFDPSTPPPWVGFERFAERLPQVRERLAEATGRPVAFSWMLRMDPQVAETWGSPSWVVDHYESILRGLTDEGDELGLHTHTWHWDEAAGDWAADYDDPSWTEHCLAMSLDSFKEALGRTCLTHRGGDHFLTGAMLSRLEEHGVKADLTVEPGLAPQRAEEGELARGSSPDYRSVPSRPYRSSPTSFPAPDPLSSSEPLLVPLLSAPSRRPPFRRVPLFLWDPSDSFSQRLAAELIKSRPQVIAFATRCDTSLSDEVWDRTFDRLAHLAGYGRMAFTTASAAVGGLNGSAQRSE